MPEFLKSYREMALMKFFTAVCFFSLSATLFAEELKVLGWNVQNEDSWTRIIANQLNDLQRKYRFDLIGLSEVDEENAGLYADQLSAASGRPYSYVISSSGGGGNDYLVILFDSTRLKLLEKFELTESGGHAMNWRESSGRWRLRSPLAAKLLDQKTNQEFLFMVNHLKRGHPENEDRNSQVRGLKHWASQQQLPIINLGDFNFDWDPTTESGNRSFHLMVENSPWKWLRPEPAIDTNWAENLNTPQIDDLYPNSILDFVFVAGVAEQWSGESDVIVRPGDFPDSSQTSDHRPISATFEIPTAHREGTLAENLIAALNEIEERLAKVEINRGTLSREELEEFQKWVIARENLRNTIRILGD